MRPSISARKRTLIGRERGALAKGESPQHRPAAAIATRVGDGVRGDAVRRVVLSDRGAAAGRRASLLRGRALAGRPHGGPPTRGPHAVVARRTLRRGAPATPRHHADDAMLRRRTVGVFHENKDEAVA